MADKTVAEGFSRGPGTRGCCMLTDSIATVDNVVDLSMNLDHTFGIGTVRGFLGRAPLGIAGFIENSGIVYTCQAGFIDLGHARDLADLTLFYYVHIVKKGSAAETFGQGVGKGFNKKGLKFATFGYKGEIRILEDIPEDEFLNVASMMAYDESVFHEIETYWYKKGGSHHSAFSPEDLVSNAFGTHLARKAITTGGPPNIGEFNRLITAELKAGLTSLGALSKAQTLAVLQAIKNGPNPWVQGNPLDWTYLRRRNFGAPVAKPIPWLVPGVAGCSPGLTPSFLTSIPLGTSQKYYVATYTSPLPSGKGLGVLRPKISNTDFAREIREIGDHAKQPALYGPRFDKPN